MQIEYIDYAYGDKYAPVVVPLLRQVPMLSFYPPQVSTGPHSTRPQTVSEYTTYIQNILNNEKQVDRAWIARSLDSNQTHVLQGGLVYRFGNSFGLYTGYAFTYAWPPTPPRSQEFPNELSFRQFPPGDGANYRSYISTPINTRDPRIVIIPARDEDS